MNYWLAKTEPEAFSYQQLKSDGITTWDGVRNYAARNNLRAMKKGDLVLIYHSVSEKCIVGIAKVSQEHFPDITATEGDWSAVKMKPFKTLKNPVSLAAIKANELLKDMQMLRMSRLSVVPLLLSEFDELLAMSQK